MVEGSGTKQWIHGSVKFLVKMKIYLIYLPKNLKGFFFAHTVQRWWEGNKCRNEKLIGLIILNVHKSKNDSDLKITNQRRWLFFNKLWAIKNFKYCTLTVQLLEEGPEVMISLNLTDVFKVRSQVYKMDIFHIY